MPNTKYKLTYNIRASVKGYRWIIAADGTKLTGATAYDPSILAGYYTSHNTADEFSQYTVDFTTGENNYQKLWLGFYGSQLHEYYDNIKLEEYVKTNVSFNYNDGSEVETMSDFAGEALTLPTPTKAGYAFVGWYTDNETFANEFTADTFPAADVTLYAKWDKVDPFEVIENWDFYKNTTVLDGTGDGTATSRYVQIDSEHAATAGGKSVLVNAQTYNAAI